VGVPAGLNFSFWLYGSCLMFAVSMTAVISSLVYENTALVGNIIVFSTAIIFDSLAPRLAGGTLGCRREDSEGRNQVSSLGSERDSCATFGTSLEQCESVREDVSC
jgi:hypothetical protein